MTLEQHEEYLTRRSKIYRIIEEYTRLSGDHSAEIRDLQDGLERWRKNQEKSWWFIGFNFFLPMSLLTSFAVIGGAAILKIIYGSHPIYDALEVWLK